MKASSKNFEDVYADSALRVCVKIVFYPHLLLLTWYPFIAVTNQEWLLMLWKYKFGHGLVPNPKAVDLVKKIMGGAAGDQTPLSADDADSDDSADLLSILEKDEVEEEAAVAAKEKKEQKKKTRSLHKVLGV